MLVETVAEWSINQHRPFLGTVTPVPQIESAQTNNLSDGVPAPDVADKLTLSWSTWRSALRRPELAAINRYRSTSSAALLAVQATRGHHVARARIALLRFAEERLVPDRFAAALHWGLITLTRSLATASNCACASAWPICLCGWFFIIPSGTSSYVGWRCYPF